MMCQVRSRSAQLRPRRAGGVFRAERTRAPSLRPELLRTTSTGRVSGPIVRRHGLCEVSFTGSSPVKNHDLERPGRLSRSNRAVRNHSRLARCPASPRRPTEHDRRSCAPSTGVHRTDYRRRGALAARNSGARAGSPDPGLPGSRRRCVAESSCAAGSVSRETVCEATAVNQAPASACMPGVSMSKRCGDPSAPEGGGEVIGLWCAGPTCRSPTCRR